MNNLKDQIQSAVDIFKSGDYLKAEKLYNANEKYLDYMFQSIKSF